MPNDASVPRRTFVKSATAAGLGLAMSRPAQALPFGAPNEKVVVGVMGLNGRGIVVARSFARTPNVEVAHLCDVDSQVLSKSLASLATVQQKSAKGGRGFSPNAGRQER
jgi:hypothetical protein